MISKKYTKYYRIDVTTGPNGKVKEETVYIGPMYRLSDGCKYTVKMLCSRMIVCTIIALFLFISGLWNNTVYAHQIYINMPALGLGIVACFYGTVSFYLGKRENLFRREEKDKTQERMKTSSLCGLILSGLALAGTVFYSFGGKATIGIWDIYFVISLIGQLLVAVIVRRLGYEMLLEEVQDTSGNKEEEN